MQAIAPINKVDTVRGQHHIAALRQPLSELMIGVILFHQTRDGMRCAAHAVLADHSRPRGLDALRYQQMGKRADSR